MFEFQLLFLDNLTDPIYGKEEKKRGLRFSCGFFFFLMVKLDGSKPTVFRYNTWAGDHDMNK